MAKLIQLFAPDDDELFQIHNHTVDVVKSKTLIYSKDGVTKLILPFTKDCVSIYSKRVRIDYSNGCYLLITMN
jgi:hypothetical protein